MSSFFGKMEMRNYFRRAVVKRNSFSTKNYIIIGAIMALFVLLIILTGEYRQAVRGLSGVAYWNENPVILLWILIVSAMTTIILMIVLMKRILDRDRLLTEAAIEIRKVTNNLHAGVVNYVPDANGKIVYASQGFYEIIGLDRGTLREQHQNCLTALVPKEFHGFFMDSKELRENGFAQKVIWMQDHAKKKYWMQVSLSKAVHGGKETVSAVFVDVSELKRTQDRLLRVQKRYQIASELSNELMFEYDYKKDRLVFAEQFSTIYGKNNIIEGFLKNMEMNSELIHPTDKEDVMKQLLHTKRIGANDIQLRMRDASGEYQWCRILYRTVCNKNGEPVTAIGKLSNISIFKREIEELERASRTDSLTGAYNKMATKEIIDDFIQKHRDSTHMLLMVDVDDFKQVNDTYGHQNGDAVLMHAIQNLRENYTDGEIIGRVGGDEFVVFIGNVENKERLIEKAQALKELLQQPYQGDGVTIPVSASLGVSMYPADGRCYEELMFCADSALYEVKASRKGNFAIYGKKEISG